MMKRRTHEIPIEDDARNKKDSPKPPVSEPSPEAMEDKELSYEQVLDQLQRLQAEFSNYRRRVERDRVETTLWAQRALIEKLVRHEDLTADESAAAMEEVMEGRATPAALAGLLPVFLGSFARACDAHLLRT